MADTLEGIADFNEMIAAAIRSALGEPKTNTCSEHQ